MTKTGLKHKISDSPTLGRASGCFRRTDSAEIQLAAVHFSNDLGRNPCHLNISVCL